MAALTDNLERGLNPAELVLAWKLAKKEAPPEAWPDIASLLGLDPRGRKLAALEKAALLPESALDLLAQGALDPENALIMASWELGEQKMTLELVSRVGPSRQNRRLILEWLDDLRRALGAEGTGDLTRLLSNPELSTLSGPQAEKKARDLIYAHRFPYLTKLAHFRQEALKVLELPAAIKLELDPDFEDVTAVLRITFTGAEDLGQLLNRAQALADQVVLDRLWALEGDRP
jgi:hypothetical protein